MTTGNEETQRSALEGLKKVETQPMHFFMYCRCGRFKHVEGVFFLGLLESLLCGLSEGFFFDEALSFQKKAKKDMPSPSFHLQVVLRWISQTLPNLQPGHMYTYFMCIDI